MCRGKLANRFVSATSLPSPCSPAYPPIHPPLPFPAAVKTFSRLHVKTFPGGASQRQNRARAPSRSDAMVWCVIHLGVPVFRTEAGGVPCKTNVGGEVASDGVTQLHEHFISDFPFSFHRALPPEAQLPSLRGRGHGGGSGLSLFTMYVNVSTSPMSNCCSRVTFFHFFLFCTHLNICSKTDEENIFNRQIRVTANNIQNEGTRYIHQA